MEKYKRIKVLGKGSFGKAYLVENTEAQEFCVVKQMETLMMQPKERDEAVKEAMLLKKMDHPNIVRFQEVFMTRKGRLCIVMDFADGGDVHMEIKRRNGELIPEENIKDWFVQCCFALRHVHERKVLHRDLKTQNIFLMKTGQVKLGDFGIARVLDATKDYAKTMVGTPYYLSPEIIEDRPYNFKSDIWSAGVVLYEMTTLKHPFDAESLHFLAIKILQGQYPDPDPMYTEDLKQLIRSMLAKSAHTRPAITQILAEKFLNKSAHETNRRFNLGVDMTGIPEHSEEPAQAASDAAGAKPSRGPRAAVEASRQDAAAPQASAEEDDAVLVGTVRLPAEEPVASGDKGAKEEPPKTDAPAASEPPEDEKEGDEYEEEFEDYSGSEDEGGEAQKNLAQSVANVKLSHKKAKEAANAANQGKPPSPIPEGMEDSKGASASAVAAHSAKADSLRTYLTGQMSQQEFDQAYRLVRSAGQEVAAGQDSLQQQVGAIIGQDKAPQLFPLFQLLCFLEDIANSQTAQQSAD